MSGDEWHDTPLGSLELRRNGVVRGFVIGSFWRRSDAGVMGSEKDRETAKIALVAACDAVDIRGGAQ